MATEKWERTFDDPPFVQGVLERPRGEPEAAIVLTHGASGNFDQPLLIALAQAFTARGVAALRVNMAYRQRGRGAPGPATASQDRLSLRRAADGLRSEVCPRVYLGGSSYGGRQASMLLADDPEAAEALLLLSYPLHPPGRPEQLRTEHLPRVRTPTFLAHGTKDAFGSIEELEAAALSLPGPHELLAFEGLSHGLSPRRKDPKELEAVAEKICVGFLAFVGKEVRAAAE